MVHIAISGLTCGIPFSFACGSGNCNFFGYFTAYFFSDNPSSSKINFPLSLLISSFLFGHLLCS